MIDPELVIRYARDEHGLMVVQTILRTRLPSRGTEVRFLSTVRRVDVGRGYVPAQEVVVGPVPMGPMPGHRGPSGSAWLWGTGVGRGSA